MEIRELLQKRASLWDEAKKFLDEHTDKDGKITSEDAAAYDKMEADIDALSKSIERYERNARMGAELEKPFNTPHFEPFNNNSTAGKTGRASAEYKSAMLDTIRNNFKFIRNELRESIDTSGGYLVPEEWDSRLIEKLAEENIVRKLAEIMPTSGIHKINVAEDMTPAAWVDEGEALTFGTATFSQKTPDAHKLVASIQITNELLNDSAFNLEDYIINNASRKIGEKEEEAFLNGDGNGKPTGIFTTAALAENDPIETASASISGNDIIDLVHKLKRPYRGNAAFIMHDATVATIRKLKDQNQAYLWQPSYTLNEPNRLFGFPVYTSAFAPLMASGQAFIAFGDFKHYKIGERGSRAVQELRELFAGNDMTGFIVKERIDGVLALPEAVKALKLK